MTEPLAITGAGAVTPLGIPPALWAHYRAGVPGRGAAAELSLDGLADAVRVRAARAERVTQLVLAAGGAALASAGLLAADGPPRPGLGVVLGTAFGCLVTNASYQRRLSEGGPAAASPRLFAATVANAAAGELGICYRLGGPAVTLTAGAAAGLVAVGHAADLLAAGRADALLAGGVDAHGAVLGRWLAEGGLDIGRPPAEAAAAVVVESRVHAGRRGARVLGLVCGHGAGFEPDPGGRQAGEGLGGAVRTALGEAGISPDGIDVVVCAAPPALAALEERALDLALGAVRPPRAVPKDILGETLAAGGPLGLLAALAEAPPGATALVLDVCASGHAAALVARRGDAP